jgi:DNA-binding protein HU-beta
MMDLGASCPYRRKGTGSKPGSTVVGSSDADHPLEGEDVNKAELIDALEPKLGSKKAASDAVEAVTDVIIREVAKGGSVGITGFGTFERADRRARTGRNPKTGETVRIKKTRVPKFRPGTNFKEIVSGAKKVAKGTSAAARASAGTASVVAPAKAAAKKTTAKKAAPAKKATPAKAVAPAKKSAPAKTTSRGAARNEAATVTAWPKKYTGVGRKKAAPTQAAAKSTATKTTAKAAAPAKTAAKKTTTAAKTATKKTATAAKKTTTRKAAAKR